MGWEDHLVLQKGDPTANVRMDYLSKKMVKDYLKNLRRALKKIGDSLYYFRCKHATIRWLTILLLYYPACIINPTLSHLLQKDYYTLYYI